MTIQSEAGVPTHSTWKHYPAHTLVEFSGKHMMFTTGKRARSSVEVEIDTPSLYSWVESRDTHLESPDFLGIERYLTITFKSTAWRS